MIRLRLGIVFATVAAVACGATPSIAQVPDDVTTPVAPPRDTGVQYASPTTAQPNFTTQTEAQAEGMATRSALVPEGRFFGMAFSKGPDSWYDPPGGD